VSPAPAGTGKRDAEWVARRLIQHRVRRKIFISLVGILAVAMIGGWLLVETQLGDRAFDGKRYTVAEVIDGGTFVIADRAATRVSMLGVDAPAWPDAHYSKEAAAYLTERLRGEVVLLKLDGTQTRNVDGRLLAYVYLGDTDLINADIIRDGRAFSDRRNWHTFRQQFDQIENEARAKARGMWDEMTDAAQPAWRIEWLRSRGK